MVNRKFRIKKNKQFKKIMDKRKKTNNKLFTIFQYKNELDHPRFGVSVSSKVGNSVERHKIKRQILEVFRKNFDFKINVDVVLIVRKEYNYKDFKNMEKEILNAIKKIEKRSLDEKT